MIFDNEYISRSGKSGPRMLRMLVKSDLNGYREKDQGRRSVVFFGKTISEVGKKVSLQSLMKSPALLILITETD